MWKLGDRCAARALRGFTLVELLVVLGIIALLIGLLAPAVSAARRSGNKAACAQNLRQIGVAIQIYVLESNGRLPLAEIVTTDAANKTIAAVSWDDLLNRPLGGRMNSDEMDALYAPRDMPAMHCPGDAAPVQGISDPAARRRSYAWVRAYTVVAGNMGVGGRLVINPNYPLDRSAVIKMSDVRRPAEQIAVAEKPVGTNILGAANGFVDRAGQQVADAFSPNPSSRGPHGDRWNYLFVDGHVESLKLEQTLKPLPTGESTLWTCNSIWTRDPND
jgi:prepilin-type N-terminal cleavage/methylation domain-containing protein/prepilin-type processing-associated H-X9-DG protein